MEFQDISLIEKYHAHIYFDESSVEQAKALCEEAGRLFQVTVGRMHLTSDRYLLKDFLKL